MLKPVIGAGGRFTVITALAIQPVPTIYSTVVAPPITAVNTPVEGSIVPTIVRLLVQVPPLVASANVSVSPTHTSAAPEIGAGTGFTVTDFHAWHPVATNVYDIVVEPKLLPKTSPVIGLTLATDGLRLVHMPPIMASLNVVVKPWHKLDAPIIVVGNALTVTAVDAKQPVDNMYTTVATPGLTPVTAPVSTSTVAIVVPLVLHVPPPEPVNVVIWPTHTFAGAIAPGKGTTVTVFIAAQPLTV
jgi:hypothetical protein